MRVGVLALQGSAEPHADAIRALGHQPVSVRVPADLGGVTHLVIPGGESTTLHHLLVQVGLWDLLIERYRAGDLALFGTCAGAILLGRGDGSRPPRLGLLDAQVSRNGYGRQVDSFCARVGVDRWGAEIDAIFIRAPRFGHVGPDASVLARCNGEPVLVEGDRLLAATFHPELTSDRRVHDYFLGL